VKMENKNKNVRKLRKANKKKAAKGFGPNSGVVISKPFTTLLGPGSPGRASMRATFQVLSDTSHARLGMNTTDGFPQWAPKIAFLLQNFKFFRIAALRATYTVTGGAASSYYIIGNVSNDPLFVDSSVVDILDDDFAGVANGVEKLILTPPPMYWKMGVANWYSSDNNAGDTTNTAGFLTFVGGGGATPLTTVGWCTVDLDVEFHTM